MHSGHRVCSLDYTPNFAQRRAPALDPMGSCLSCLQDDTRRAENARIIPMGQELSHYEARRTRFSHTHTLLQSPFAFPLACSDRKRATSLSLRSRRTTTRMAQNQ